MAKRLPLLVLLLAVLAQDAAAGPALVVARQQVNIRADATVQSSLLVVLRDGDEVELTGRKDEWLQIRMADSRAGWVHASLVQEVLLVTGAGVRLRAAGSTAAKVVAVGQMGDELRRIGQTGTWLKVQLASGEQSWIWERLTQAKIVDFASAGNDTRGSTSAPAATRPSPAPTVADLPLEAAETAAEPAPRGRSNPPPARRSPFVEGLQHELDGEHTLALAAFLRVPEDDPGYVKAQLRAATAYRRLGERTMARARLDAALQAGAKPRTVYAGMAELYQQLGAADSLAKYRALAEGQQWTPVESALAGNGVPVSIGDRSAAYRASRLVYAAGGIGAAVLLVILAVLFARWRRRSSPGARSKFRSALDGSRERLHLNVGEADELDQQIAAKRQELHASAAAFHRSDPTAAPTSAAEDDEMDHMVGQLDVLRRGLEAQDQRAQAYADLVRLQTMKIEALEQELAQRRRRPG
jgi:SH3-like domain-containing protein